MPSTATRVRIVCLALVLLTGHAQDTPVATQAPRTATAALTACIAATLAVFEPPAGTPPRTFTVRLTVDHVAGLPRQLAGGQLAFAVQAPDRLHLATTVDGQDYAIGRDRGEAWIHVPGKRFAVIGSSAAPRFASQPGRPDGMVLLPLGLPIPREQLALLPLMAKVERAGEEVIDGVPCERLDIRPLATIATSLGLPDARLRLWVRHGDDLPARLAYGDDRNRSLTIDFAAPTWHEPWADARWRPATAAGDQVETVALSHLVRFVRGALDGIGEQLPSLGPATGARRLVGREGAGRLEDWDGTRVLFLSGTPEQMGRQQGILLKSEVRGVVGRILYGVGVGSSFARGRWFIGEIEAAVARMAPHVDPRHLREMDALAAATGLEPDEIRLANFFPELFHCSGFALSGAATAGGALYHGRVLDYLKGVGLEQHAVVTVVRPDQGHAWINLGYAGFIGSVTAMNERRIAIGEMGGRGEGAWDGTPMAQLMRAVMERAATLDEAVAVLREARRTCEYYYVVSDGNTGRAVGIAATPERFEVVGMGEAHPLLPEAIPHAVLLSAGDRYRLLAERVRAGHGRFDAASARALMDRPVAMSSNIQSVLFAPGTLEVWVANADGRDVASATRYTRYDLGEMLRAAPAGPGQAAVPIGAR